LLTSIIFFSYPNPNPNPNPTHLPKHEFLSSDNQFYQRIWLFGMYIVALCMRTWCEVRNFASQKFRLTPGPRIFQFWESKSCQTPTIIDAIETGQWFCLRNDMYDDHKDFGHITANQWDDWPCIWSIILEICWGVLVRTNLMSFSTSSLFLDFCFNLDKGWKSSLTDKGGFYYLIDRRCHDIFVAADWC